MGDGDDATLVVLGAVVMSTGCKESPTVLEVSVQVEAGVSIDVITVTASAAGKPDYRQTFALKSVVTMRIQVEGLADRTPVSVQAEGTREGTIVILQRAVIALRAGRVSSRTFDFTPDCAGLTCTQTQTCDHGACVGVATDVTDGGFASAARADKLRPAGRGAQWHRRPAGPTRAEAPEADLAARRHAVAEAERTPQPEAGAPQARGEVGEEPAAASRPGVSLAAVVRNDRRSRRHRRYLATGGVLGTGGVSPSGGAGGGVASCQVNATQCSMDGLQTCGTNGQWGMAVPCGPNQTCGGAVGSAKCTCASTCTVGVTECASSTSLGSCAAGPNSCNVQSTAACGSGLVCERFAPASCADPSWAEWPVPPSTSPTGYTDNGDGTVTDNTTGLMWEKTGANTPMTQPAAVTYCATMATTGGHSDWRLPSKIELLSIVDYGRSSPSINPIFMGTLGLLLVVNASRR